MLVPQPAKVGWRDQQRAGDTRPRECAGAGEPMGKGVAAEAVRRDEHGFALGFDRGGDLADPFILIGMVPVAEFDSLAIREFMFPQALPVGRAAVVKAREDRKSTRLNSSH